MTVEELAWAVGEADLEEVSKGGGWIHVDPAYLHQIYLDLHVDR